MNPFVEHFELLASAWPERTALWEDGGARFSYAMLASESRTLATQLSAHGIGRGDVVALEMPKSAFYVQALLGCWMAGAAFVTIDPALPQTRRNDILSSVRPKASVRNASEIIIHDASERYDPALSYIYYTSGSTGIPKGVMMPHNGVVPVLKAQIDAFGITRESRGLWILSHQFDASLSDIGTMLLAGAMVCVETKPVLSLASSLSDLIAAREATHVDLPPALLGLLNVDSLPASLQTIITGGEICHPAAVRAWAHRVRLVNVYGPTEATICTSMKPCDPAWELPDIGTPLPHVHYHVYDPDGVKSEEGELWISGEGLALGYAHQPELTAQKFVHKDGQRMYRTGDLVRRLPSGDYIFLGRCDRQLKIHGQLVAPEETEAVLLRHPQVHTAAMVVPRGSSKPVAYVTAQHAGPGLAAELRQWVRQHLPASGVPACVVCLDALPRTAHGKIDFDTLTALPPPLPASPNVPASPQEALLQRIWKDVLQLSALPSVDADFFDDLGGDSLNALSMILAARAEGLEFSAGAAGEYRTIRALLSQSEQPATTEMTDAAPVSLLLAQASLSSATHTLCAESVSLPRSTGGRILITGATGFLGAHVLIHILQQYDEPVDCLVRGNSETDARRCLWNTLVRYGYDDADKYSARVSVVTGDIILPGLGISTAQWNAWAHSIREIYHCAGRVNMMDSLSGLFAQNVRPLQELVRLACTGTLKTLHAASSLSVFVASDQNRGICREDNDFSAMRYVYGGYAQSKWLADQYLRNCKDAGADVRLYRFGLLTGDSVSGMASPHDYLAMFVRGITGLGALPDLYSHTLELDVTPVDYAARAWVACARYGTFPVYHIAGSGRFSLQQLQRCLQARGLRFATLNAAEWRAVQPRNACESAAWMALCRATHHPADFYRFRGMDLFQATDTVFDQSHTRAVLDGMSIACPDADDALLMRYLHHSLPHVS